MNRPLLMILLVPIILPACTSAPYHVQPRLDGHLTYGYPSNYYDYHYYPDVAVYFHLHSRHYIYRHDGHWVRTRFLPKHIHLDRRARRHIVYKGDNPYVKHHEHQRRYGPGSEFRGDRSVGLRNRDHRDNQLVMYPEKGTSDHETRILDNRDRRRTVLPEARGQSTSDHRRKDTVGKEAKVHRRKPTVPGKRPLREETRIAEERRHSEQALESGQRRAQQAVNKKQPGEARRTDRQRRAAGQAIKNEPESHEEQK